MNLRGTIIAEVFSGDEILHSQPPQIIMNVGTADKINEVVMERTGLFCFRVQL